MPLWNKYQVGHNVQLVDGQHAEITGTRKAGRGSQERLRYVVVTASNPAGFYVDESEISFIINIELVPA